MEIKDRIQIIIDNSKFSSAQFADTVGIQRSTLSHILNGRNNVSTDIISKIHVAYPNISTEWLMFGTGNMEINKNNQRTPLLQQSLFDELNQVQEPENRIKPDETTGVQKEMNPTPINTEANVKQIISRKIIKIMVYYSDNTFESFSPDH